MRAPSLDSISFITARKRSLSQGNVFTGVCQSFCSRGGVSLSGVGLPDRPPWTDSPTPHMVKSGLLECILVFIKFLAKNCQNSRLVPPSPTRCWCSLWEILDLPLTPILLSQWRIQGGAPRPKCFSISCSF